MWAIQSQKGRLFIHSYKLVFSHSQSFPNLDLVFLIYKMWCYQVCLHATGLDFLIDSWDLPAHLTEQLCSFPSTFQLHISTTQDKRTAHLHNCRNMRWMVELLIRSLVWFVVAGVMVTSGVYDARCFRHSWCWFGSISWHSQWHHWSCCWGQGLDHPHQRHFGSLCTETPQKRCHASACA